MVLGGGDGSKPSVSFLNFEPKVSKFPSTRTETVLVFSPRQPLSGWRLRRVILVLLLYRLATDICTVEQPICVLVVELAVDDILTIFDGVCCCDQHVDTSAI